MLNNSNNKQGKVSSYPRDVLEQAELVREGWDKVSIKLDVPHLSMDMFMQKLSQAKGRIDRAEALKAERARAIQERNQCLSELWDLTKRIRNAAKATFGDYSEEFDLMVNPRK